MNSPAQNLLSRFHTLRAYAVDVKEQAESERNWQAAVHCAAAATEATDAIEFLNLHAPKEEIGK